MELLAKDENKDVWDWPLAEIGAEVCAVLLDTLEIVLTFGIDVDV